MKELSIKDKELLLKDLCARLPYEVCVHIRYKEGEPCYGKLTPRDIQWFINSNIEVIKPYLRPMSSMTEEEKKYISDKCGFSISGPIGNECGLIMPVLAADWLIGFYNERHIDYRGLIEKGLALEAPEGIYK